MTPHKPSGSLREGSSFPFLAVNSAHLWGAQLLCCLLPGWERSAFIIPLPIRAAGLVLQSGRWQKGSGCLTGRWEGQNGPKRGLAGKTRAVWFLRCWRALAQERKQHCCFQLPSFPVRWSHWVTEKHHSGQPDHQHSTLCSVHTLAFTTRPHCQDDFIISQMTGVDSFYHPRHPGPDALRSSVVCAENSQSCGSVAKIAVYLLFQDLQDTLFYQRVKWKNRAVLHFSSAFLRQER